MHFRLGHTNATPFKTRDKNTTVKLGIHRIRERIFDHALMPGLIISIIPTICLNYVRDMNYLQKSISVQHNMEM